MMNQSVLAVNATKSLITPNLWHASRLGKTTVPVRPMQSVYAQFKHIIGVPARNADTAVPFTKLKYLDNLIDRLVRLHSGRSVSYQKVEFGEINNIDGFIQTLQGELKSQVSDIVPPFGGLFSGNEALINLVV
jgi:hypothetical protein